MKYQSSNTGLIYEIEFNNSRNNIYLCPECSKNRKKSTHKDLKYYKDSGRAYCHHCQTTFFEYKPYQKEKTYVIPENKNLTSVTDKALKWFKSRGISQSTINRLKIYSDIEYVNSLQRESEVICFPYIYNDQIKNIKSRGANKSFQLVSGAELILYNLDSIKDQSQVIICEGEMDVCTWVECGYDSVVGVPNGANKNLEYIENYIHLFDNISKIYISYDNDTPGIELRDELIRRFGHDRCFLVNLEGKKDANDYFLENGREMLLKCLSEAKLKKVDGVICVDDIYSDIYDYFQKGDKSGLKVGIDSIDEYVTWETSRLAVATGIPSSGKSEFVDFILMRLNLLHGWKSVYFTPENYPLKYHYEKLFEKCIGKKFNAIDSDSTDFDNAVNYIQDNFFWIMPEEETNINYILERTKYLIKTKGIKCLVIDPYNKLDHQQEKNQSETQYISKFLDKLTHFCKLYDILIILIAHPYKMPKGEVPTLYSINGSSHFYNKCDYGFTVHRAVDENNLMTYVSEIHWQKIKFKNLGKQGITEMKYNSINGRYEEKHKDYLEFDNGNWVTGERLQQSTYVEESNILTSEIPF